MSDTNSLNDGNDDGYTGQEPIIYKTVDPNEKDTTPFLDHEGRYEKLKEIRKRIREYIINTQSFVESLEKIELKNQNLELVNKSSANVDSTLQSLAELSLIGEDEPTSDEKIDELEGNDTCELLQELNKVEYSIERNSEYWRYKM